MAIFNAQSGPCAADLAVTALTNPPAVAVPGAPISVTDTVTNNSGFAAGSSRTQYYLSLDAVEEYGRQAPRWSERAGLDARWRFHGHGFGDHPGQYAAGQLLLAGLCR